MEVLKYIVLVACLIDQRHQLQRYLLDYSVVL
jgi:hypothetical protein